MFAMFRCLPWTVLRLTCSLFWNLTSRLSFLLVVSADRRSVLRPRHICNSLNRIAMLQISFVCIFLKRTLLRKISTVGQSEHGIEFRNTKASTTEFSEQSNLFLNSIGRFQHLSIRCKTISTLCMLLGLTEHMLFKIANWHTLAGWTRMEPATHFSQSGSLLFLMKLFFEIPRKNNSRL